MMADNSDTVVIAPPKPTASPFAATSSDSTSGVADAAVRWASLPSDLVAGSEIIILAIKPSMWRPLFDSAPWLVTASLLATALTVLGRPLPGASVTASAQIVLLIGIARLGLAVVRWVPTWYVLTNRRIIDIQGVRTPRIAARPLVEVRNTYLHASPVERAASLGTITFVTQDEGDRPHHWQSVVNPDDVHAEIRRAIENAIDTQGLS